MEALISIPDDGEPLKVFLSVTYVQRSLRGYGVGVQFVGLSSAGQARWTRFVGLARGLYARQRAAQKMGGQTPQVVVCADAMSQRALLSLQEQRLDITHIRTPDELRTAVAQGRCEHIVLDLSSFDDHWAQALRQARCLIPSLQVWFLTSRDGEESLSKGLALEADVVVAKPCSHDILAMQLRSEQQSGYANVIPAQLIERVLHA